LFLEQTSVFAVAPAVLRADRLDYLFQHPSLDPVHSALTSGIGKPLSQFTTQPEYGENSRSYPEGDCGFLNVQHLQSDGRIDFDPPGYLEECPSTGLLDAGDILIARTGSTLGKAALITEEYKGFAFGSFCLRFRVSDPGEADPGFVACFLNSKLGRIQSELLKTGSGKHNINAQQVGMLCIPRIDVATQCELRAGFDKLGDIAMKLHALGIAEILSARQTLFAALGLSEVSDERNLFFQTGNERSSRWFSRAVSELDDRLHFHWYHPESDQVDNFVKQCQTSTIGEILSVPIIRGVSPEYDELGDYVALKTADLRTGFIDYDNALRVTEEFFLAHTDCHVRKGDVVVAATGLKSMGKVEVYEGEDPALLSGELLGLRVSDAYDPYVLCEFLRSRIGQLQFNKRFSGSSGQIHIYDSDVSEFLVPAASGDWEMSHQMMTQLGEAVRDKRRQSLRFLAAAEFARSLAFARLEDKLFPLLGDGWGPLLSLLRESA